MIDFRAKWVFAFLAIFLAVFVLGAFRLSGFVGENSLVNETFPFYEEKERKSIMFVGDIMLARSVERSLLSLPQEHALLKMKELFQDNFVVGNFEASVPATHEPTPNFTFKFSVTPQLLPVLKSGGVKYLSLANNHALDHGVAGYRNTLEELKKHGMIPFGHPTIISSSSISYIDLGDKKVSVIGISNLFYKPTPNEWGSIVEEAKENSDLQIVYIHWGEEYELVHSWSDREFAEELIDAGVDVIVGHHPHVVQDIWRYNNGIVFYSLGNFIFDQYWEDAVLHGLALDLTFVGDRDWQIKLVPIESKNVRLQPREMVGEMRESFLKALSLRSDPTLAENIVSGVISLQF